MAEQIQTIVYVEDEPEMIDLVRLILSRMGYNVLGAEGRDGLELIRRQLPDLILLDLMMPDMDGWEIYQQLKAEKATCDIPVIVVTAKAQSIDKVLGLHIAKVDDYVTKPFGPQELLDSVEKVLAWRQESYLPAKPADQNRADEADLYPVVRTVLKDSLQEAEENKIQELLQPGRAAETIRTWREKLLNRNERERGEAVVHLALSEKTISHPDLNDPRVVFSENVRHSLGNYHQASDAYLRWAPFSMFMDALYMDGAARCKRLARIVRNSDNNPVKCAALIALAQIDCNHTMDLCSELVSSTSQDIRVAAAQALGKVQDVSAIPLLSALLHDPSVSVRFTAMQALASYPGPDSVKTLSQFFDDLGKQPSDKGTRIDAAKALGKMPKELTHECLSQALAKETDQDVINVIKEAMRLI